MHILFNFKNNLVSFYAYHHILPGACRTGVLSFLRVLPPLLLSTAGGGVTFSGAGGVEDEREL